MKPDTRKGKSPSGQHVTASEQTAIIAETNYLAGFFEDGDARHRLREAAQLEIARREL